MIFTSTGERNRTAKWRKSYGTMWSRLPGEVTLCVFPVSLSLQTRDAAQGHAQAGPQGKANVGERVARYRRAAEPGLGTLHGAHARATHPPVQTAHH